jgi:hypothetical protein
VGFFAKPPSEKTIGLRPLWLQDEDKAFNCFMGVEKQCLALLRKGPQKHRPRTAFKPKKTKVVEGGLGQVHKELIVNSNLSYLI